MRLSIFCLLAILGLNLTSAIRLKKYNENYHRPVYHNRAHRSEHHVDYNRQLLEERLRGKPLPQFDPNEHKTYYVHILYKGSVLCPGALISRRMVMTSARCFVAPENDVTREYKAKHMSVVTGDNIGRPHDAPPHPVVAFFYMPASKGNASAPDIALIALKEKLNRNLYRYIKLHRRIPKVGESVQMAFVDPTEYEITLYKTKVVGYERCKQKYEKYGLKSVPFNSDFICVANKPHSQTKTCSTRPGDPLIIDNELAGINLYGEHCDKDEDLETMDIYFAIRHTIKTVQRANDMLRAFTGTGPFNMSAITKAAFKFGIEETADEQAREVVPLVVENQYNNKTEAI